VHSDVKPGIKELRGNESSLWTSQHLKLLLNLYKGNLGALSDTAPGMTYGNGVPSFGICNNLSSGPEGAGIKVVREKHSPESTKAKRRGQQKVPRNIEICLALENFALRALQFS